VEVGPELPDPYDTEEYFNFLNDDKEELENEMEDMDEEEEEEF
jgi:hypothetical protein